MKICLILEGSYPYVHGGVSTWMHQYIKEMKEHEFVLWVIGALSGQRGRYVYELPENVREIHEVFLEDALHVEPEAENILITPICAHDVASRCIVASDKRVITVGMVRNARRSAFLSVDGGKAQRLNMGDVATIRKSKLETKLLRLKNTSFYDIVNGKFRKT